MLGATESDWPMPREPHMLPEAFVRWENTRGTEARIRRVEEAWAMHACRATGFAAGETAYVERDG